MLFTVGWDTTTTYITATNITNFFRAVVLEFSTMAQGSMVSIQATKATLGEVAKHYLEASVWSKAIITYLDKMSETPD